MDTKDAPLNADSKSSDDNTNRPKIVTPNEENTTTLPAIPGYTPGPTSLDIFGDEQFWKDSVISVGQGEFSPKRSELFDTRVVVHYKWEDIGSIGTTEIREDTWKEFGGDYPVSFSLRDRKVLKGLRCAVQTMKRGERALFCFSPQFMQMKIDKCGDEDDDRKLDSVTEKTERVKLEVLLIDFHDFFLEGITRKLLEVNPSDPNRVLENMLLGDVHPNHRARVEAEIEGTCDGVVFYPRKNVKFFVGDGAVENLPIGIDAAMTYLKAGERSMISLTAPKLMLAYGSQEIDIVPQNRENGLHFEVKINSFENNSEFPEEKSTAEKVSFCRDLNTVANKLYDLKICERAAFKFQDSIKYMKNASLVGDPGANDAMELLELQFQAHVGLAKCLLETSGIQSSPLTAVQELNLALKIKPDSVEALCLVGKANLQNKNPDEALKNLLIAQALDSGNSEILLEINNARNMQRAQKEEISSLGKRIGKMFK